MPNHNVPREASRSDMLNNRSDTKLVQLLVAGTHDAHERHLRAVLPVVMSVALCIASNSGKTKMSRRSLLQTHSFCTKWRCRKRPQSARPGLCGGHRVTGVPTAVTTLIAPLVRGKC